MSDWFSYIGGPLTITRSNGEEFLIDAGEEVKCIQDSGSGVTLETVDGVRFSVTDTAFLSKFKKIEKVI